MTITVKITIRCLLLVLTLNHDYALATKPILPKNISKLILPTELYGKLPLNWAQLVTYTPEAVSFILQLKQDNYPLYEPTIGLALDGLPTQPLLQPRIDPHLFAEIEKMKSTLDTRLQALLHPDDKGVAYPYTNLINSKNGYSFNERIQISQKALSVKRFYKELDDNEHGTKVAALILADNPIGASVAGKLGYLFLGDDKDAFMLGSSPDVVNFSANTDNIVQAMLLQPDELGSLSSDNFAEVDLLARELSEDSIVVISAGNHGDNFSCIDSNACRPHAAIIVGSNSPSGHVSEFSNYSDQITILAPGELVPTINSEGEVKISAGTSFAAPQVTAALVNVKALIPSLSTAEAEHMLKMTATPTTAAATGIDGAGVLNHYRLLRVAHRIAQEAKESGKSVHELIFSDDMYDFRDEANFLITQGFLTHNIHQLRQGTALDPHDVEGKELAAYYKKLGFESLSLFYDNPSDAALANTVSPLIKFIQDNNNEDYIRANLDADLVRKYLRPLLNIRTFTVERDNLWLTFLNNPYTFAATYAANQQKLVEVIDALIDSLETGSGVKLHALLELTYERRIARVFPAPDGGQLNIVEWAIINSHESLLKICYRRMEEENTKYIEGVLYGNISPHKEDVLLAEIITHTVFAIKHSDNPDMLASIVLSIEEIGLKSHVLLEVQKDYPQLLKDKPHLLKILQQDHLLKLLQDIP